MFTYGYANVDLLDELYKDNVMSQEHNMNISGGSKKMNYYVSFNYLQQNGLLEIGDDGLKRYNVAAKINADITMARDLQELIIGDLRISTEMFIGT